MRDMKKGIRVMRKVVVVNGKAYVTDERWVTIGGEDEDGSGQHVLIKENGTITAGFGTGKNVKNAFEKTNTERKADTPEKANKAVKAKTDQDYEYSIAEIQTIRHDVANALKKNLWDNYCRSDSIKEMGDMGGTFSVTFYLNQYQAKKIKVPMIKKWLKDIIPKDVEVRVTRSKALRDDDFDYEVYAKFKNYDHGPARAHSEMRKKENEELNRWAARMR